MTMDIGDHRLSALSEAVRGIRRAIASLLQGDGRDTDDIPGYDDLADRHATLIAELRDTPAEGKRGLVAKARAVDPGEVKYRSEAAIGIALSLITDVISVLGPIDTQAEPDGPSDPHETAKRG